MYEKEQELPRHPFSSVKKSEAQVDNFMKDSVTTFSPIPFKSNSEMAKLNYHQYPG